MVNGLTQKELRRNHGCLWQEHLNLNLKWSYGCTTGKEITELVSTAILMKLMPRQMATNVRYSNSKTMKETIGLADDFWWISGMDYEVTTERDRSTNQWKQHRTDNLVIQENRRQVPSKWIKIRHNHCRMYKNQDGGKTRAGWATQIIADPLT